LLTKINIFGSKFISNTLIYVDSFLLVFGTSVYIFVKYLKGVKICLIIAYFFLKNKTTFFFCY